MYPMELPPKMEENDTSWKKFKAVIGPGFVIAIAYLDPGNFQADIQAGSESGYRLIWTVMWATILSLYIQMLCVRLSIYKQTDLAKASGECFPTPLRITCWAIAEYSTIITDIPEVIGMGIAFNVLFGWRHYIGVLLSFASTIIFLSAHTNTVKAVEFTAASFLGILCITMFIEWSSVDTDAAELIRGWIYGFVDSKRSDCFNILGIVGCVVMPHNLYLHSGCLRTRTTVSKNKKEAVFLNNIEMLFPLIGSIFANMAVIVISAENIYLPRDLSDAGIVNFSDHLNGRIGNILWGLALLSSAQSSCVTTTYTGQFVMEGFINWKIAPHLRACLTRAVTILPCLLVAVFSDDKGLNFLINFVNSSLAILLPFALTPLVKFVSSPEYMGEEGAPSPFHSMCMRYVAFTVYLVNAVLVILPGAGFLGDFIVDSKNTTGQQIVFIVAAVLAEFIYFGWNLWVVLTPLPCHNAKRLDNSGHISLQPSISSSSNGKQ